MDYKQIDNILNKYFEGNSSLEEEKILRKYFASGNIAESHRVYKGMFEYFEKAQNVTNPLPVRLNHKPKKYKKYLAGAAAFIIGLGLIGLMQMQTDNLDAKIKVSNHNPEKQKEAINEIKKFSKKINQGIEKTDAITIFGSMTQKIFNLKNNKK
jgi:hypothetical protein